MSWDKNTISKSTIKTVAFILDMFKIKYDLNVRGKVDGFGLNNINCKQHELFVLKFEVDSRKIILADVMIRTSDCDSDDFIQTLEMNNELELEKMCLEIQAD
jgi:hypothetical protein